MGGYAALLTRLQAAQCRFFSTAVEFELKMAKLSEADKMRIQTLREQGLGAKAIKAAQTQKQGGTQGGA